MGIRVSKPSHPKPNPYARRDAPEYSEPPLPATPHQQTPARTPRRWPFPPPSPAKHLKAVLLRRHGAVKPAGGGDPIKEEEEAPLPELDKSFGFPKKFASRFEIGEEVGRGHFGQTCSAIAKKGAIKGQKVAVKIIPKAKLTTAVAIEDVRREVQILRALSGHPNLAHFYDAFEDTRSVYIVMELCEGGELLDRIMARGGKFSEDDAKDIIVQILNIIAFCHLQGVVHRDIKPENFLFTSKDENSVLKAIDFGLSDFVRPEQKLIDIVGSAYYVAPEVLRRSYDTEADIWSVGVIAYILLCGTRPFWGKTESGIFRSILRANPSFDEGPWPSLSEEAKDFARRLLDKDPTRRITASQALCHPWIRNHDKVILAIDVGIFRAMKGYMRSSSLRKTALRALSKTLTEDELFYLRKQFALMRPEENGGITLQTIKTALGKNATDAAKESRVLDYYLEPINVLQYRKMYFEEFCAAAINVHQIEALGSWEQRCHCAYEIFEKDGNRVIVIEELSELGLSPSVPVHTVVQEMLRYGDGKLTFQGFVRVLLNQSTRLIAKTP